MKFILFIALIFSTTGLVHAQDSTGVIRGILIDEETGEPLVFTKVLILDSDSVFIAGTYSDDDGLFSIGKIKPGTYQVYSQSMGYETGTVKNVVITPRKIQTLKIYMEKPKMLEPVKVNRHYRQMKNH